MAHLVKGNPLHQAFWTFFKNIVTLFKDEEMQLLQKAEG